MLRKILLLASLVSIAYCGTNNIPRSKMQYNKYIDCSKDLTSKDDCEITLVVEAATSMTYTSSDQLRGYRAVFNETSHLQPLVKDVNGSGLQPPIQTDGEFRPIITINGCMPGSTIIASENQRLKIIVYTMN